MDAPQENWTRRQFIGATALASVGLPHRAWTRNRPPSKASPKLYVFSKPLDHLTTRQLMQVVSQAGLDGVDLTVRPGGHVQPENVAEALPAAVAQAKAQELEIKMITTGITGDGPTDETVVRAAAKAGVQDYRMGYLSYDFSQGITESLDQLKPQLRQLEALNRQYGIHAAYQNHVGTRVGAQLWDLWYLLHDLNAQFIGCEYDIRHAVAEGGRSWAVNLRLIAPYIRAIVIKDFLWKKQSDGSYQPVSVPLGEGMVPFEEFLALVQELNLQVPYSLHFEYDLLRKDEQDLPEKEKIRRMTATIKKDVDKLKTMISDF